MPAADSHAKCGIVTPRGARLAGIVNIYIAGSSMPAAVSFYVVILAILVTIVTVIKKRALVLTKARFIKSGDDLLSHKHLQYHRRCWA